jgi:hypothetical protein
LKPRQQSAPMRISDDVVPQPIDELSDHQENLRQPAIFGVAFSAPRADLSRELGIARLSGGRMRHCIVFGGHEQPPYSDDDIVQRHTVRLLSPGIADDEAAQMVERVERCSNSSFERRCERGRKVLRGEIASLWHGTTPLLEKERPRTTCLRP